AAGKRRKTGHRLLTVTTEGRAPVSPLRSASHTRMVRALPGGPPKTGGSPRCERASAAPTIADDNQNRLGRSRLTREETCTDEESLDAKGDHVGEDCVLHQPPSPGAVCTVLCTRWNIVRSR